MKKPGFLPKSILFLAASTTLTFSFQSQSQAGLLDDVIEIVPKAVCTLFCPPETEFGGSKPPTSTTPTPPPPENFYKSIRISNQTRRTIFVQGVFHINGKLQPIPRNEVWIIEKGKTALLIDGTRPENKITSRGIDLNISDGKSKLWDMSSGLFITPTDEEEVRYFTVDMAENRDFTFIVKEAPPRTQPWIFPIFP